MVSILNSLNSEFNRKPVEIFKNRCNVAELQHQQLHSERTEAV